MSPRRRAWRFEHERALKSPLRRAKPSAKMNPTRGEPKRSDALVVRQRVEANKGVTTGPPKAWASSLRRTMPVKVGRILDVDFSEGSSIAGDETWQPDMWRREQLAAPVRRRDLHSEPIWITHGEIVASGALHAFDARALDPGP